jgi:energy-coupling factor transporter ATP-binding protein EcfA2
MDPEKVTYFGETDSRGKRVKFGIKAKDRTRHVYVIGKTGMGKSTLLENMAIQDLQNGEGMAFIDPHGKTAELLLNYVPPERINDVVYFAPFDIENPISFNVLEDMGPDKRHLVVAGLMSAFKKIWLDAWSARMEYILTNSLLALLEYPGSTLLGVNKLLSDKEYRKKIVDNIKDPSVKSFWVDEFAKYTDRQAAEAVPAIQNKIGQFTANPLIRNIVGQSKSSFDIRKLMDEKKIFIVNLSKGRVGETNANLLGSMLITKIYLAAMSRADVQEKDTKNLPNFYLYVDEFQSFANESFADILSEARKYKLNLTIAHQYIEQMSEEVRAAVFGNAGTEITFRVGAIDAEVLEKEYAPQFTAEDLVNLGMYQMYLKLMIDGVGSVPFSASSLPPYPAPVISYKSEIIASSRKNFAKPRAQVEADILSWIQEGRISTKPTVQKTAYVSSAVGQKPVQFQPATIAPKRFPERMEPKKITYEVKKAPVVEATTTAVAKPAEAPIPVAPVFSKPIKSEKPRYSKKFPPIDEEESDDFLPLKELAKKLVAEPKKEEVAEEVASETPAIKVEAVASNQIKPKFESHVKTMSQENLADLRSALAAVMKKTEAVAPNVPVESKPEILKTEPQIKQVEPKTVPQTAKIEPKMEEKPVVEELSRKTEISKEKPVEAKKPEVPKEKNEEPKSQTREISEEELKKILGL